jgi:hypothetical protein
MQEKRREKRYVSLAAKKETKSQMNVTAQNFKFVYFVLHLLMDKRKQENASQREVRERDGEIHKKC